MCRSGGCIVYTHRRSLQDYHLWWPILLEQILNRDKDSRNWAWFHAEGCHSTKTATFHLASDFSLLDLSPDLRLIECEDFLLLLLLGSWDVGRCSAADTEQLRGNPDYVFCVVAYTHPFVLLPFILCGMVGVIFQSSLIHLFDSSVQPMFK